MSPSDANANIARHLALMAASRPDQPALKVPRGRTGAGGIDYLCLTFAELAAEAEAWRALLAARGVRRGDRTLVMVRPGLPLIAAVFALFQLGAVPVIIDPGMGLRSFLGCVARSRPRVLVGIPFARFISHLFRRPFASLEVRVPASGSLVARLARAPSPPGNSAPAMVSSQASDLAAILFTSGSTGSPKGVCYEHGMFEAQVRLVRDTYGIAPGEVDLPLLPIFALFNPALGMTTIVPEIDPRRPAAMDPARIVQAIRQEGVTNSFGSPTLWRKIFDHCLAHDLKLPELRRVLCAGASVPTSLYLDSLKVLSDGGLHSPYGATEALPVSSTHTLEVLARDVLSESVRFGTCVGRTVAGMEVRIIQISDEPIPDIAGAVELPQGEIGEIIVRGPVVTKAYDGLPEATQAAKIRDGATVWHRMGDCGRIDGAGRLWFCGRKAERVVTPTGTLFTDPCEQVFRATFAGLRVALIGLGPPGQMTPAVVVEDSPIAKDRKLFLGIMARTAQSQPHTAGISRFYIHPRFPVDTRHNAKIHRLKLARWAATAKAFVARPRT
ncbi:MAG TPA: fatty acid CoA ligase family protein [Opitutaceae bacterium]|nr:fatty acid CoA ligase family protein [Opitutaceae bacterium]